MPRLTATCFALGCLLALNLSAVAQTEVPSTDCNECADTASAHVSLRDKVSAKWDLHKQHADLIADRNDAWPKPFLCYDRRAYHQIFVTMQHRGWDAECTLTDDHFNADDQKLNLAGKAKIAGIMLNLPEAARRVHVYNIAGEEIGQQRLAEVRRELSDRFGSMSEPQLAVTTHMPHGMSGSLIEDVQKKFVEGLPDPKVPAASASTITGQ
jgi:hypothetical protein